MAKLIGRRLSLRRTSTHHFWIPSTESYSDGVSAADAVSSISSLPTGAGIELKHWRGGVKGKRGPRHAGMMLEGSYGRRFGAGCLATCQLGGRVLRRGKRGPRTLIRITLRTPRQVVKRRWCTGEDDSCRTWWASIIPKRPRTRQEDQGRTEEKGRIGIHKDWEEFWSLYRSN